MEAPTTMCPQCKGSKVEYRDAGTCPQCKGTGELDIPSEPCRDCFGTGKFVTRSGNKVECRTCKGSGRFKIREWLESRGRLADFKPKVCRHENCNNGHLWVPVKCEACGGTGKAPLNRIEVYMPEGIEVAVTELSA